MNKVKIVLMWMMTGLFVLTGFVTLFGPDPINSLIMIIIGAAFCPKILINWKWRTGIIVCLFVFNIVLSPNQEEWDRRSAVEQAEREVKNQERQAAELVMAEQRRAETAARKVKEAAVLAKKQEEKRSGLHCLGGWNGDHSQVTRYTKRNINDPKSFEHIKTSVWPVNPNGENTLVMQFRARNGFGGMVRGKTVARINNETCQATIESIS